MYSGVHANSVHLHPQEEQHGGPGHGGAGAQRVERLSEELDDMERRVEQVGEVAFK